MQTSKLHRLSIAELSRHICELSRLQLEQSFLPLPSSGSPVFRKMSDRVRVQSHVKPPTRLISRKSLGSALILLCQCEEVILQSVLVNHASSSPMLQTWYVVPASVVRVARRVLICAWVAAAGAERLTCSTC